MIEQIGGVFIHSNNAESLAKWYSNVMGLTYDFEMDSKLYGLSFHYKTLEDVKRYVVFSISQSKTELDPNINKSFTLNFRIKSMDEFQDRMKRLDIKFEGPEVHDEGKFAWVIDPDGNRLEVWEDN